MLKKINKDSNGYKLVRGAVGNTAFVGGGICVESVALPFAYAIFKSKPVRAAIFIGNLGLATVGGLFAENGAATMFDIFADGYNATVDLIESFVGKKNKKNEDPLDIRNVPDFVKDLASKPAPIDVNDMVLNDDVFIFSSEDAAKAAVDNLAERINLFGFTPLEALYYIRREDDTFKYDPMQHMTDSENENKWRYGWTTLEGVAIEQIDIEPAKWIADLTKLEDVSEHYVKLFDNGYSDTQGAQWQK